MVSRMRRVLLLTAFVASVALAQEPTPAEATPPETAPASEVTPPPPPPVVEAPPPVEVTPAAPKAADRVTAPKARHSRFSAGPGGPLYAFAQGLDGLILGAMIGGGIGSNGTLGTSGAFLGALGGAVVLGGAAIALQYAHPIGTGIAGAAALGLGVGALLGFGITSAIFISSFSLSSAIALGTSQAIGLIPILALWNSDDISGEDLALMGMTSAYAFGLTLLTTMLFTTVSGSAQLTAILCAPAVGMGLGALWATGPDLAPGRILKLTALPMGVGLLTFLLGLALSSGNMQITAAGTLLTTAATFGLTYFLTAPEEPAPAQASRSSVSVQPTFSMVPAGWRNEGLAVGPGLVGRF